MCLPLWARAEWTGNRADGVVFRRRAVTCRILIIMVIVHHGLRARVFISVKASPIEIAVSHSSAGCAHPPPSVLLQWKEELDQRFGLTFVIFDRDYVRRMRQERGFAVNPWAQREHLTGQTSSSSYMTHRYHLEASSLTPQKYGPFFSPAGQFLSYVACRPLSAHRCRDISSHCVVLDCNA